MRKKLFPGITEKHFFFAVLLISTAVRCFLSVFPKWPRIYFDELVYMELGQNIWLNGRLSIYHTGVSFSKILYPVFLSPFYAISDPELRINVISVFNALLVSSALIPAYLLAKRILHKRWQVNAAVMVAALSPNMGFAFTYMAENLYIPMSMWAYYCGFLAFEKAGDGKPYRACFLGICCWLLYLTKEAGSAFLGAVVLLYIYRIIGEKGNRGKAARSFGLFLASFLLPFLAVRLTVLGGTGYTYAGQVSFSRLLDPEKLLYGLKAALIMMVYFAASWLSVPVVFPVSRFRKLDGDRKKLLILGIGHAVCLSLGIAFGVSVAEDMDAAAPRIHMRYFISAVWPFLLVLLAGADDGERKPFWKQPVLYLSAAFAVLIGVFANLPRFGSTADSPVLFATLHLYAPIPHTEFWFKTALCLVLAVSAVLWLAGKKRLCMAVFIPVLAVTELLNGIPYAVQCIEERQVPDREMVREVSALDRYIDTLDGNVLVVADNLNNDFQRLMNAYTNDDYYTAESTNLISLFREGKDGGVIDLGTTELDDPIYAFSDHYPIEHIEYIICGDPVLRFDRKYHEEITPEGLNMVRVFRSADPERIAVTDEYVPGEVIYFGNRDVIPRAYIVSGLSSPESGFTWSSGKETVISLTPDAEEGTEFEGTLTWAMLLGNQSCLVTAGDNLVYCDTLPADSQEIHFPIPADSLDEYGRLVLRFTFPDAWSPGNGDSRILAVAFRELRIDRAGE